MTHVEHMGTAASKTSYERIISTLLCCGVQNCRDRMFHYKHIIHYKPSNIKLPFEISFRVACSETQRCRLRGLSVAVTLVNVSSEDTPDLTGAASANR